MIPQGLQWTGFQREHLKEVAIYLRVEVQKDFILFLPLAFVFIILPGNADVRTRSGNGKEEYGSLEKSIFLSTIYIKPNLPMCICEINFAG